MSRLSRSNQVTVYVAPGCIGCNLTFKLIQHVEDQAETRDLITVVDTSKDHAGLPSDLFAVPSWYVNGTLFSLGNPTVD